LTYLKTSPDGLAPAEAQQRLAQYGPNELEETHARSRWDILLDQFKNVMLLLLIAVAILSGVLDVLESFQSQQFVFPKDTIAILAIVVLNGLLGYIQESKAEQALLALKKMSASRVR
ncbi:MAG: cation-transporting P-type ATPase, partial [Gloeomargarita sp. SKYG98]|nr:cation-transporting P-type ATPase [Gloeomargarita sp. SKYG98]